MSPTRDEQGLPVLSPCDIGGRLPGLDRAQERAIGAITLSPPGRAPKMFPCRSTLNPSGPKNGSFLQRVASKKTRPLATVPSDLTSYASHAARFGSTSDT